MSSFTSTSAGAPAAARPRASVRVFELHGPGSVAVAHRALPLAGALLRVETTGVCGTDHHIWAGKIDVPLPQLLGHEVIGRLERLPDDHGLVFATDAHAAAALAADAGTDAGTDTARPLAEGERILIAPGVPCGDCDGCGDGGRCLDRPCYGLTMTGPGLTGGFSPYMELLPGTRVYRVPEGLAAERVVFAEPMACVLSALRKAYGPAYVPAGLAGLVLGFGVIGLCSAVAIHASGGRATVVEYDPTRRALAAELGFETAASVEEAGELARARGGFPLVVDAAGTPAAFKSGLELLAWSGTLVEIGNFADLGEIAIKPSDICLRDLRVVGSGETFYEDFDPAIALVASTTVELPRAITDVHRFDTLADPSELFTVRAAGKAMVTFT
jgi:threonine dehydrogenase-like Zn-dependent dehydrogenase